MEYGPGDAEKYRQRLKNQRRLQRIHREMQEEEGIPERDDVAKVVLAELLDHCLTQPEMVDGFVKRMADRLTREKKQFDPDRSAETIRNMIDRARRDKEREERRRASTRRRGR